MHKLFSALLCGLLLGSSQLQASDNLQAFPVAEAGMTRHVLVLPAQANEHSLQVQLIVGKELSVDADNRYFFSGRIEAQNIAGWGYTRYLVSDLGQLASTLMAIDPAASKVERFITLGGEPYLVRYNSKLPLVVYVPAGSEVRYRIWAAQNPSHLIGEG